MQTHSPPGSYGWGPWTYNSETLWVLTFGLGVLAICVWFLWALMRSPWGRVIKGIREDEEAIRALGKNVFAYKLQALIIGGIFGGMGGIIYARFRQRFSRCVCDLNHLLHLDVTATRWCRNNLGSGYRCSYLLDTSGLPIKHLA